MEMALREAKARLSELVAEACRGERVVITNTAGLSSNWCAASGAAGSISTSWKKTAAGSDLSMRRAKRSRPWRRRSTTPR